MSELNELFLDELADILYAEKLLVKTLHKMAKAAEADELLKVATVKVAAAARVRMRVMLVPFVQVSLVQIASCGLLVERKNQQRHSENEPHETPYRSLLGPRLRAEVCNMNTSGAWMNGTKCVFNERPHDARNEIPGTCG